MGSSAGTHIKFSKPEKNSLQPPKEWQFCYLIIAHCSLQRAPSCCQAPGDGLQTTLAITEMFLWALLFVWETILYFVPVYSPYIPSERISDLHAFSVIQPVCSAFVTLGKEPNAVPKSCPSHRKEGEVHVAGFPMFAASFVYAWFSQVYLHREGPVLQTKVKCFSVETFPQERLQHQTFLLEKKTSFRTEIFCTRRQDIFALCNIMKLKTRRLQHEATKEGCFILFPDF